MSFIDKRLSNRRQFLIGAGGMTLALPALTSLMSPRAAKAAAEPIKRFVAYVSLNGQFENVFWPTAEADTRVASDIYTADLSARAGKVSPVLGDAWTPFKSKMNVLRGLDNTGSGGHNNAITLTASGCVEGQPPLYGKSIDVLMESSAAIYPVTPKLRIIRAATEARGVSWDRVNGDAVNMPCISNDAGLFDSVFSGVSADPTAAAAVAARERRASLVDRVMDDYRALVRNTRISAEDKSRLDQHVTKLHELQGRIRGATINACEVTQQTPFNLDQDLTEKFYQNIVDTISLAFACDLTRVAVLHVHDYWNGKRGHEHHENSHSPETGAATSIDFNTWIGNHVVRLAGNMDAIADADGKTMLDNSLIFWGNELSYGLHHRYESMPTVTLGGAGGAIRTGRYIDYRQRPNEGAAYPFTHNAGRTDFPPMGRSYTQLMTTFMRAMGMQPSEYMAHGDGGGFGQFRKTGDYQDGRYDRYESVRNDPLPEYFIG